MADDSQPEYKLENLVVLQYSPNNCYVQVRSLEESQTEHGDELKIDLSKGTWSYREWADKKIGVGRVSQGYECRYGIIGVYDRKITPHLGKMVDDGINSVKSQAPLAGPGSED